MAAAIHLTRRVQLQCLVVLSSHTELSELQVERLSKLLDSPPEELGTDGGAAGGSRRLDIINSAVNIDARLTKLYDLLGAACRPSVCMATGLSHGIRRLTAAVGLRCAPSALLETAAELICTKCQRLPLL